MAGHVRSRTYSYVSKKSGKPCTRKRWQARYPNPNPPKGKLNSQIEKEFATKREAGRWLVEQTSALNRGQHINPADSDKRVEDVVGEWRKTRGHVQPRTRGRDEEILEKHILPRWGGARIGAVQAAPIQDWVNELAASGLAPDTVKKIYGKLLGVMKLAVVRRYISFNPCDSVTLPHRSAYRLKKKEMLFLGRDEVAALADAVDPRYRVLIYTAAYMGLRAGELYGLQRKHVDLLRKEIRVERALKVNHSNSEHIADADKGVLFGPTKTHETRRVALPSFLAKMLEEHLAALPGGAEALVFSSPRGEPMHHLNLVRRYFRPAVKRALPERLHPLRFHDLRHTCASLMIAQGVDLIVISRHLGHANYSTTADTYSHMLPSVHDETRAALDAIYAAEPPPNVLRLRG